MGAVEAYFSLGSNQGDRRALLERALRLMQERLPGTLEAVSRVLETEPWGFVSPHPFLNLAARFRLEHPGFPGEGAAGDGPVPEETVQAALQVLDICQGIERELGRPAHTERFDAQGKRLYSDRAIDIDLVFLGDLHIRHPRLTVPHPRWEERDFVRIPLRDVATPGFLQKLSTKRNN